MSLHGAPGGKRGKMTTRFRLFLSIGPGINPFFIPPLLLPHRTVVRGGRNTRPFDPSVALYLIPHDSQVPQQPQSPLPSFINPNAIPGFEKSLIITWCRRQQP